MNNATLLDLGFTTTSPSRAVNQFMRLNLDLDRTNALIAALVTDAKVVTTSEDDLQLAHYTCAYMIQDIVKSEAPTSELYEAARQRALELRDASYQRIVYTGQPLTREDENGNIISNTIQAAATRTRGGKSALERAQTIVNDNPTMSRKDLIALMVAEIDGLKEGTAASYYWKVTKDMPSTTRPPAAKASNTRETRSDQVRRVFESKPEWADRNELLDAIVAELDCTRASANTFSYVVMPSTGRKGKSKK